MSDHKPFIKKKFAWELKDGKKKRKNFQQSKLVQL